MAQGVWARSQTRGRAHTGRESLANLVRRKVDQWLLPSAGGGRGGQLCLLVAILNSSLGSSSRYRNARYRLSWSPGPLGKPRTSWTFV
eukprot:scaffold8290_cov136-Isochrysis_galbana.AAC.4